jgi:drug/metabolite transporter (DMT)-like permease
MNTRIRATITVLIGATLLGSMGAWGRTVYRFEGDPMVVVTWRAIIGVAVLAGILGFARPALLRIPWKAIPFFLAYGFFGVTLNFWSYFSAVKYTTLAVAITLLYTYPMFVTLFSAVWLGERLTRVKLAAAALTVLGVALVAQIHQAEFLRLNLRGILFGLLTGLSMAVYSILGKRAVVRYAPWTVVLYAFAGGALFLVLGSGPGLLAARDYPTVAWVWIVGLALIPSLGGYALFTLGLRDLPASQVSVIATWEVVTAALLGWLLYGERLTPIQLLGAALVCVGILWIQRARA